MKIEQILSRVIVQSVNIILLCTEVITYSCTYFNEKAHEPKQIKMPRPLISAALTLIFLYWGVFVALMMR